MKRFKSKILTLDVLTHIVNCKREDGLKVVFTSGCYDLFHIGHLGFIERVRELYPNHSLIVAVNSDVSVMKFKGSLPVNRSYERILQVAALDSVRWVVSFDEASPAEIVKALNPEVIIHGCAHGQIPFSNTEYLGNWSGELKQISEDFGPSTSERIRNITHKGIRTDSVPNWIVGKFDIQEFLEKISTLRRATGSDEERHKSS